MALNPLASLSSLFVLIPVPGKLQVFSVSASIRARLAKAGQYWKWCAIDVIAIGL
jgi:hypothetical protein